MAHLFRHLPILSLASICLIVLLQFNACTAQVEETNPSHLDKIQWRFKRAAPQKYKAPQRPKGRAVTNSTETPAGNQTKPEGNHTKSTIGRVMDDEKLTTLPAETIAGLALETGQTFTTNGESSPQTPATDLEPEAVATNVEPEAVATDVEPEAAAPAVEPEAPATDTKDDYTDTKDDYGEAASVPSGSGEKVDTKTLVSYGLDGEATTRPEDVAEVKDGDVEDLDSKNFQKAAGKTIAWLQRAIKKLMDDHKKWKSQVRTESRHSENDQPGAPTGHGGYAPPPFVIDGSFPTPIYKPGKTTPEHYISELKEYFILKGIPKTSWHIIAGRIFPEATDEAEWYKANKASIKSWSDFKAKFKFYETSELNIDALTQKLFAERQFANEAFESFAWRVHNMFKKIKPEATEKEIVDRILNSCVPEIAAGLIPFKSTSIDGLVKQARLVISNLNKIRRQEGKPSFRMRKTDMLDRVGPSGGINRIGSYKNRGRGRFSGGNEVGVDY